MRRKPQDVTLSQAARTKAVIYTRVSSKEQEKEGFSIPAQLKLLKEYGKEKRFAVTREFVDVETAKQSGRSGFREMVKFLKDNPDVKTILVEKTDRLYRNFKDYVILEEFGVEIHLVKEGEVISKDSRSHQKFIHGIKVLMAKNYIDNLSEETRKGQTEKAEQGIYPSYAPLGYLNVERDGDKVIEPDPDRAPQVRQLFEWYSTGQYSLSDLVHKAAEAGFTFRRTGAHISKSTVARLLGDPIYYGDFEWDGKMYRGKHAAIVSKELWLKVQNVLAERERPRPKRREFAFTGLLKCGHCGCSITAEIKKGRYVYYHCTGHKGKCPGPYIREEDLGRLLGETLKAVRIDEDVLEWLVEALRTSHAEEKVHHDQMISALQTSYRRIQDRLDKMYVDKLDGNITEEFYEKKRADWVAEQDRIMANLDAHQKANRNYLDKGVELLELAHKAYSLYVTQTPHEQRRLLDCVLSNCTFSEGQITPTYRKPFDSLAVTNAAYQKEKAISPQKDDLLDIWLPG